MGATSDRCTCQNGRDADGAEFGPCEWCEEQAWRTDNGMQNEDLEALLQRTAEPMGEQEAMHDV